MCIYVIPDLIHNHDMYFGFQIHGKYYIRMDPVGDGAKWRRTFHGRRGEARRMEERDALGKQEVGGRNMAREEMGKKHALYREEGLDIVAAIKPSSPPPCSDLQMVSKLLL